MNNFSTVVLQSLKSGGLTGLTIRKIIIQESREHLNTKAFYTRMSQIVKAGLIHCARRSVKIGDRTVRGSYYTLLPAGWKKVFKPNARFWVYINGADVKLTLRKGQMLCWFSGVRHGEDYEGRSQVWKLKDGVVHKMVDVNGSDCDGPYARHNVYRCALANLHDLTVYVHDGERNYVNQGGPKFPVWKKVSSGQRDIFAEMMGY